MTKHVSLRPREWRRVVRWGALFAYQDYGALLLFIPAVVITVSHWTFQQKPVVRQALIYDATISYPYDDAEAVSNSLATLFNWLVFLAALPVVELAIFRRQHSLTAGLANMLHHAWSCVVVFVTVIAITEITKPFTGRLRPDFLARCRPEGLHNATATSAGSDPLGVLRVGQAVVACSQPNADTVHQGRLSFPSGHASNTMSVAWYTAMYLMWSLFLRDDAPCPRRQYATRGLAMRLAREVAYAFAYAWVLLALCLSFFIGITRFWDNVHAMSDIVGGWLLAIIFTTPWVVKAIGTSRALVLEIDADDGGAASVLPITSSGGGGAAAAGGGGQVAIDVPPPAH